jgi:hypothetical protein
LRVDGILIVVRDTPVVQRDVGVAHRMIDQENRDLISDLAFRTAGVEVRGEKTELPEQSRPVCDQHLPTNIGHDLKATASKRPRESPPIHETQ